MLNSELFKLHLIVTLTQITNNKNELQLYNGLKIDVYRWTTQYVLTIFKAFWTSVAVKKKKGL